jgi:cyclic beta-1,2-glucan synthetase
VSAALSNRRTKPRLFTRIVSRLVEHRRPPLPPWNNPAPVREELFGVERLEQHAESLAAAQAVTGRPSRVVPLQARLDDNAAVLLKVYRSSAADLEAGLELVPAADWLLDNYHLVEQHIREIHDDLPPGYYRQLPKLAEGPFAGYPRVFGLAWAFVAHTDSHFDPAILARFIAAYQRVQPLTIGELWAVAITLRIVLIENLRRLAEQIAAGDKARAEANVLADRLLVSGNARAALELDIATRSAEPLSERFAAQLAKRLRDRDPRTMPALGWLEERLVLQGTTADDVVHRVLQRQGASNLTVRNIITSLRLISDTDWAELFESVSLVDHRLRAGSNFAAMDFATRNLYRSAIEQLARGSYFSEVAIAAQALGVAREASDNAADPASAERAGDPGYHLIGQGRHSFERSIRFRPPLRLWINRFNIRLGLPGYVAGILLTTATLLCLALWALADAGLSAASLLLFALFAAIPTAVTATALTNRAIIRAFGTVTLPGLELKAGVPPHLRTLIAVPTLLSTEAALLKQIEGLEVHYLSGADGDLIFALITDGLDADQEVMPEDALLLDVATEAMAGLNRRYGPAPGGANRFLLLHRRRVFVAGEGKWMGWERKRGKLHELNRLLRGATDTTFMEVAGTIQVPRDVRYVITLDGDTRLPRDAALKLIGKMAHPLNRPKFGVAEQRVVDGYAILQPRVTPSLPVGREGSLYQRVFSGPGGIDPYAAAVSDVYQDLFGEGSYTGKGIYEIDAFEAALAGRVPDGAMLSHDLFEGIFARAGLATDVEVVEDFPPRYDVAARRQHRWIRGDWQLLPWIFGVPGRRMPGVGRWKMVDNLLRSVASPLSLAALALCWLFPMPAAVTGTLLVLANLAIPAFLPAVFSMLPRRSDIGFRNHMHSVASDLQLAARQTLLAVAFLADHAWGAGDGILRTLIRLFFTRRHLLEWTTAAQSAGKPRLDLRASYRAMVGGLAISIAISAGALLLAPASWPLVLVFGLTWLGAPALAVWVSQCPAGGQQITASESDAQALRRIARHTWRFFETFVTETDNMLPPDNFQEDPKAVLAHRTSPTNIGLYLLSAVAARDFGWAGTVETVERLEATFASLRRLPRFKGHFFNWYGTRDLQTLTPAYVSSVDSGNLAGHLIALANACDEWLGGAVVPAARRGMLDNLHSAREALAQLPTAAGVLGQQLDSRLREIEGELKRTVGSGLRHPALMRLTAKAAKTAHAMMPAVGDDRAPDLIFWTDALRKSAIAHGRDRQQADEQQPTLDARLAELALEARTMAKAMDFAFLLEPERKLLSIGYSVAERRLDPSCYDLLASEARLASLVAIAKGDVATRHWLRLGRAATPVGSGSALISWSGSMFEYLMPSLVIRAPIGSLLEQTNRLIVGRQQSYARSRGIPWGISESAYNARDIEFTYQYSNFGVPGLGLKRGLSENLVIAPYATGLAAMVDPHAAALNYTRLAERGAAGQYGFYEAIDFTPARLPDGEAAAVVRCYMAHHQGMTIVAIANTLDDGRMRARFHREPMIQACELLLQERLPRDVAIAHPRAEEVKASTAITGSDAPAIRRIEAAALDAPATHLLSNGRYAVMLTAAGGGYSRWRDIAVTRWREDATRDNWGSFIYLRDAQSAEVWSASAQPLGNEGWQGEVVFGEDHAEFVRTDGTLTTAMEVLVSGENNGEVRRISLINNGRRPREIEITSYAELVLTTPPTDNAHPAFAKLFVETEFLSDYDALIATRRRRSPDEPEVWAAHLAVLEGDSIDNPQYETDRSRFLGRCGTTGAPAAMAEGIRLSGTAGVVLDPIFSLRHRVRVPAGGLARLTFWTLVASSRAELLDLVDQYHDRNAFERAKTLAWTQAQVQLRHLDVKPEEAADFQRLAAPLLYSDPRFRPPSETIVRGAGAQSGLWPHAVSGDLPIVLLRIDDVEDMAQVRQLLRAHEYWRMKRLAVDLVIVNERTSSYLQDLQSAIETAVRSSQSRPRFGDELAQGTVTVLRADLMSAEARALLQSVARIALVARRGSIAEQLARLPQPVAALRSTSVEKPSAKAVQASDTTRLELEFFNGTGGFARNGREYVTILEAGNATPAPWINVIANPGFGFQVAAEGSGYTWAENSRENQISPWSNDPTSDPAGEAIYLRDEASGEVWTPTAQPIDHGGTYIARHGYGYSRFEHSANGIALELLQYVPLADPIKISRLTIRNLSNLPRRLSVTAYTEWVLGASRGATAPFVSAEIDGETGALMARNPWSTAFPGRVAFADLGGLQTSWTADRTEFLGRRGGPATPAALQDDEPLSGATGAGIDPCAALQCTVDVAPGEAVEVVSFIGQCTSLEACRALIGRYRATDLDVVLKTVTDHWDSLLGSIQVKTPDRAMDIMLNGWLLYQTLACRIWARSAFYQASGAYGFRDQLQDGMALSFARPGETRDHLLRAAGRQFVEGDMQHWWLPQSGQGVRTRISDDRAWLAFATATYIAASGDAEILDTMVPFLEGPSLAAGQHDAFFQPMISDHSANLFEHCARGLDGALAQTGEHGLPLIGTGDWNDGMNRVGEGGKGESVWLGWLLLRTVALFGPLAETRDADRVRRWQSQAAAIRESLERESWDGAWYRRATFDDGTWLGSKQSVECRIDSIAQSWAVLSAAADPVRAATAMASLEALLIRPAEGIAPLFSPPFDAMPLDPGYIKAYPPGIRENGGQYSHAAMWTILAFAKLGAGDQAHELFALLNPINHARTPAEVNRYKVEPYVVAADVYSVSPHVGRGGWTWYTGSAAWMYRAGIEGILGIRREGASITIKPSIPSAWPGFEVTIQFESSRYEIVVENRPQSMDGTLTATLDGVPIGSAGGRLQVPLDGRAHRLSIVIGPA